jgi:predicted molibdopterin-dependent oxidoreductase YjgC
MSAELDSADTDEVAGELTDDVVASVTVQERGGTVQVSVPKQGAQDLGIQKGDQVLFTGAEGDRSLRLNPSETVLGDD